MELKTHKMASEKLVGRVVKIEEGKAEAVLETTEEMKVDERGLIHGGFTFGLADLAAMAAVNEPYVVLGKANVLFVKPVKMGERLQAIAKVRERQGKKFVVEVAVYAGSKEVLKGEMTCYALEKHVLES